MHRATHNEALERYNLACQLAAPHPGVLSTSQSISQSLKVLRHALFASPITRGLSDAPLLETWQNAAVSADANRSLNSVIRSTFVQISGACVLTMSINHSVA